MIKKAYIIEKGTELEKVAQKYLNLYRKGPSKPRLGIFEKNLEQKAREEAELNLAEKEFWQMMKDYVHHSFRESLTGDWHLQETETHLLIEQDSVYVI